MMMVAEEKFLLIECEWKIGGCGGGGSGSSGHGGGPGDDGSQVFGLQD